MIRVPKKENGEKYSFWELYDIVKKLRSPEGCPWDREQTHYSLVEPMIEEAYEAVDAIEKQNVAKMTEEVGDVMLQSIYHAIIGEENGEFTMDDVTDRCARKMLSRHTHIFGDEHADNASEALQNWEQAKLKEKGFSSLSQDLLDIPAVFPAVLRAQKSAKKIRKAGKDAAGDQPKPDFGFLSGADWESEEAVGALLYEVVRMAERRGIDCELALKRETDRVIAEKVKEEKGETKDAD